MMKRIGIASLCMILVLTLGGSGLAWAASGQTLAPSTTPVPIPPPLVSVSLTLRPDPLLVAPGASALFHLGLQNTGDQAVQLSFSSGQQYDLEVRGPNGYFWRWSKGRAFTEVFITMTLQPGEKKEFQESWPIPQTAASGTYSIVAWITAQEIQPNATSTIQVSGSSPLSGPQVVYLADQEGSVLLTVTERTDLLEVFRGMLAAGNPLWVGGKLEKADNPPWSFRFQADGLTAAEVTAEGLQAASFAVLQSDLTTWLGMPQAYVSCRVLGIDSLPFPDIEKDWAYHAILALSQQKIIEGYPDGFFRQDRSITRAEFAKMVVLASNLTLSHPVAQVFSDVPASHWAADFIATAVQAKLFEGYPDGTFRPEGSVDKEQVVAVLVRKVGWVLSTPTAPTFQDLPAAQWSFPYVETAMQEGLFQPSDPNLAGDLFQGTAPATRAQISVLLARLLAQYVRQADSVVIEADSGGGLVPVEFFRQHVPAFHLYGDGTVIALRGGSVQQASFSYSQGLDLVTVLLAYGFLQMEDHYQPDPMPADLGTTYLRLHLLVSQKEVSEYAWGAPAAFHYLYSYLRNVPLGKSQEYIPTKSMLFVSPLGAQNALNDDQKGRLVQLPVSFLNSLPSLAELSKMGDGYSLDADHYAALAPLLAAHERIIVAVEKGLAYSLVVKIKLPQAQTNEIQLP